MKTGQFYHRVFNIVSGYPFQRFLSAHTVIKKNLWSVSST